MDKLFNFDVLHLNHQHKLATPLFFNIKKDGIYSEKDKLPLKKLEFGHFKSYPYDIPHFNFIVDFKESKSFGYLEKDLSKKDMEYILSLLEKYGVYLWIFKKYHEKSLNHELNDVEGYDWYLEMVFKGNVIWHLFGFNDYPDTYVNLAREILDSTDLDLLELNSFSDSEIKLFEKYSKNK